MAPKVSVIIPLYGTFDFERVQMSIESLKAQKRVDLEISVVEQSDSPKLSGLKGITYMHTQPLLSSDGFFIPGLVRNLAAKSSRGEFIYNNDGDIIFIDSYYLYNLLQLMGGSDRTCLYHPSMRRLPLENFKGFKNRFKNGGIQKALEDLDLSQPYGATYTDNFVRVRHFKKEVDGKLEISVATQKDHKAYLKEDNQGKEPFFYTLHIHAGGTLMRKDQFETIGGYCEDFVGWGCHDVDLQYKLRMLFDLKNISQISRLEVLHLDHKREYFSNHTWAQNRTLLIERQSLPLENIVRLDKEKYDGKRA